MSRHNPTVDRVIRVIEPGGVAHRLDYRDQTLLLGILGHKKRWPKGHPTAER